MKHQKTATVFAVLAAVTALIPVVWAIFEETPSLFSAFRAKVPTILSVAVVQLLFAVGCLPPKREKLIPWLLLFPAGLSLVNSVFLFSSIWQIGLYATLARPIAGVTLLLFLLCIISLRTENLRVKRIVSLFGPLPFVLGLASAIAAAPIYHEVYYALPVFSPKIGAMNFIGTFINTVYLLFTGLWLSFHVQATIEEIKSHEGKRIPAEGYVKQTVIHPDGSTTEEWVPQDPEAFMHVPRSAAPRVTPEGYVKQTVIHPDGSTTEEWVPQDPEAFTHVPRRADRPASMPQAAGMSAASPQTAGPVRQVPPQTAPETPETTASAAPAAFTPPTPQPGEPPVVVTNEMLGKLKMLQDLKQDGVIDEAEFQARRQKIFNVEK